MYIAWKCFPREQCGHFLVFLCILIDPFTSSYYQYNASSQMITYFEERYPFQKVFSPEFQLVYGSLLPFSLSLQLVAVFGGFAACVVVGLLFAIFMPIIGLFFCCCYCCCKRCGKAREKTDPKAAGCKRATFCIFLAVFATLML